MEKLQSMEAEPNPLVSLETALHQRRLIEFDVVDGKYEITGSKFDYKKPGKAMPEQLAIVLIGKEASGDIYKDVADVLGTSASWVDGFDDEFSSRPDPMSDIENYRADLDTNAYEQGRADAKAFYSEQK